MFFAVRVRPQGNSAGFFGEQDIATDAKHTRHNERSRFEPLWRLVVSARRSPDEECVALGDEDARKEQNLDASNGRSVRLAGLRSVRQRRGLTQRELAALAKTGQQTVCQLETLRRGAYPKTIRKLASALGVAPVELMRDHRAE